MKHNLAMYDTGMKLGPYAYGRRNEGFVFATAGVGAVFTALPGIIMTLVGIFDPTVPFGVAIAGMIMLSIYLINGALILTHRNFLLNTTGTRAMDAVYRLPKETRKKYNITRAEANSLSPEEARDLEREVEEFMRVTNGVEGSILRLTSDLSDFNKVAKEIGR